MTRTAGQTGHLHDHDVIDQFVTDINSGKLFAASADLIAVMGRQGVLETGTGKARFTVPFNAVIIGVSAAISTAPTGSSVVVDVNKNGTTVFTNQGNRPQIPAAGNACSEVATMDVTSITAGDYLTVDVDQVGSTVAGADLTVSIRYKKV